LCIKFIKLIAKYFFLADILVVVGHLRFGYLGGHFRLELSSIQVNMVR